MKKSGLRILALLLPAVLTIDPAAAQTSSNTVHYTMGGVHTIVFDAGFWSLAGESSGEATGGNAGGFVGTLSHRFWLNDRWAVGPSISVLDTGARSLNSAGDATKSVMLTSILFSVDYAAAPSEGNYNVIFYFSAGLGPYMTSTAVQGEGEPQASMTTFGARPGAGMYWFLSDWVLLDFGVGYHLVTRFDEPVGANDNFSGLTFSMGLGLAL